MGKRGIIGIVVAVVILAIIGILVIPGLLKSSKAEITALNIAGINVDLKTVHNDAVEVEVPYGTDVTKLVANITVSPKATVEPAQSAELNFSNPVIYTITAENKKTVKKLTVTVKSAPNTEAKIDEIDFPGLVEGTAKRVGNNITTVAKYGTDIRNLAPAFGLSKGATIDPVSEMKQDFSKGPVTYKVTAQDGTTTKDYTVTVTVAEPAKKIEITKIVLAGREAEIDTTAHTARVELPDDAKLNAVVVTDLVGTFGKVKPALAVGDTLDFSKGAKTFVFSPEDSTVKATKKWTFVAYHETVAATDSATIVIAKGEGVEHALIRQLLANPYYWGYVGSFTNRVAVRKWAGSEAHRLAILAGYVDYKTGKEVRVAKVGTVYQLARDNNGKIVVYEYASYQDFQSGSVKPTDINVAASSFKEAKFAGADKDTAKLHVQEYEYIYTPIPCMPEDQQPSVGEEGIIFPSVPVPVWPAGIPI